jgi:hypothetical protein
MTPEKIKSSIEFAELNLDAEKIVAIALGQIVDLAAFQMGDATALRNRLAQVHQIGLDALTRASRHIHKQDV